MQLTYFQAAFLLFFFPVLFLLIIFGDTVLGLPFLAVMVAVFAGVGWWSGWKKRQLDKVKAVKIAEKAQAAGEPIHLDWLKILFVTITLGVASTLFTTLSVPLTFFKIIVWSSSLVIFVTLLELREDVFPRRLFEDGVVLTSTVLIFLSCFFSFFPDLAKHLPPINLLISNYGHNHAAIIFLFALPFCLRAWLFAADHKEKVVGGILSVLHLLAIGLSLGRVILFLSVVCVAFIGLRSAVKWQRRVSGAVVVGSVGILVGLIIVPNVYEHFSGKNCQVPFFQNQVCKRLIHEARPAYWSQAVRSFLDRPITGSGAGTFAITSRMYVHEGNLYSVFAHNEYLQFLSETGWLASCAYAAFWVLVVIMAARQLWLSWKKSDGRQSSFRDLDFLTISILLVLMDAMFDYNLSYVAVWLLLMCGVAFFVREFRWTSSEVSTQAINKSNKSERELRHYKKSHSLLQLLIYKIMPWAVSISVITVLVSTGLYIMSSWFWSTGQRQLSLQVFPLISWRAEKVLKENLDNEKNGENGDKILSVPLLRERLITLYLYHIDIIQTLLPPKTSADRLALLQHLTDLDPSNLERYTDLIREMTALKTCQTLPESLRVMQQRFPFDRRMRLNENSHLNFTHDLATLINLCTHHDPALAAESLVAATEWRTWIVEEERFLLLDFPEQYPVPVIRSLLTRLDSSLQLWQAAEPLSRWYVTRAKEEFTTQQFQQLESDLAAAVALTPWENQQIFDNFSALYQKELQRAALQKEQPLAELYLASWQRVFAITKPNAPEPVLP